MPCKKNLSRLGYKAQSYKIEQHKSFWQDKVKGQSFFEVSSKERKPKKDKVQLSENGK